MHDDRSSALSAPPSIGLAPMIVMLALLAPLDAYAQGASSSPSCERLASSALPNTTIASAQSVAARSFTPPQLAGGTPAAPFADLPAFCRVVASTHPYYENVVRTMGADQVRDSVRLFMVPGMHHCFGGTYPGAYQVDFDPVQAVRVWKTSGKAPDQIVVTTSGTGWPTRKRLVCAYPNVSRYKGSGDTADPANFTCGKP